MMNDPHPWYTPEGPAQERPSLIEPTEFLYGPPAKWEAVVYWGSLVFVAAVIGIVGLCMLAGCVTAHEVAGIRADIDTVAGQVNELGLTVGDVTFQGGQGDSVTMWILAVSAASAGFMYPIVWRPIRKRVEMRRKTNAKANSS